MFGGVRTVGVQTELIRDISSARSEEDAAVSVAIGNSLQQRRQQIPPAHGVSVFVTSSIVVRVKTNQASC